MKRPATIGLILVGVVMGMACALRAEPSPDLLARMREALAQGRYEEVVALDRDQLLRGAEDATARREALVGLGAAWQALGHYPEAEAALNQAAEESVPDAPDSAWVLLALGDFHLATRQLDPAREELERGLALARRAGNSLLVARLLNNLGNVLMAAGAHAEAAGRYAEALEQPGLAGDRELTAIVALNRARNAWRADLPEALARLDAALEALRRLPEGHARAVGLAGAGQILFHLVQKGAAAAERIAGALEALEEAARIGKSQGLERVRSQALGHMGRIYETGNRLAEARQLTRQALFHAQTIDAPDLIWPWQWQTGRLLFKEGRAEEAILHLRKAAAVLAGLRQELYRGPRDAPDSFRERIAPLYYQLADLLLRKAGQTGAGPEHEALLREARATVEQLKTSELQNLFQDPCVTALKNRSADVDTVERGSAVYYPILLPDRLEILLTLPDGLRQITVSVRSLEVEEEARQLRTRLEQTETEAWRPHARRLHAWLIEPVRALLRQEQVKTLVVVPDGLLRTIPFATFHDGARFLAEEMALVVTPSLRLTDPRPLPRQQVRMLVSALSEGVQGFAPLPHVAREVEGIRKAFPNRILMNQDYTVAGTEEAMEEQPYTIVHIASHGQFDRDPKKTFLLAHDGKLTMNRLEAMIGQGRFKDQPVELLTLSACQTAVGDDQSALGLAGVAIRAGARSALASLWFIDDASTALLIDKFYQQLRNPSLSKAEALRLAQGDLIADPRWRHPGYWSAFILIGNWL
ncbi:MAG: CHAT domain-containing protein [Magnetococcales bacterium]|nr:CHAT domain-containing protein [Magnetococcales bacterium]